MMAKYEFTIKKDTLNSGKEILTPMCRKKATIGIFTKPWERIVKLYDQYVLMELDFFPELSYADCEEHIKGYQKVLSSHVQNTVVQVEYHSLEEKEL